MEVLWNMRSKNWANSRSATELALKRSLEGAGMGLLHRVYTMMMMTGSQLWKVSDVAQGLAHLELKGAGWIAN